MCTTLVLQGGSNRATWEVARILERRGLAYELELDPDQFEIPVLLTPAGRFAGLLAVKQVFGFPNEATSRRRMSRARSRT